MKYSGILAIALTLAVNGTAQTEQLKDAVITNKKDDFSADFKKTMVLAQSGNADAQYDLAVMYAEGQGVPKNDQQAVSWYQKAADQGYASAQNSLGVMYDKGEGVAEDNDEAVSWFRKAIEQGNSVAECSLGEMYEKGELQTLIKNAMQKTDA